MAEQCLDALRCDISDLRQAMSIHTRKITDACRDKDCIEDLRVYLTTGSQTTLESATGAKVRCAELLYTGLEVEPVTYDSHHYCIDITFYYRILADATTGTCRTTPITGLGIFSKRAVLCGEDSRAHVYRSDSNPCCTENCCCLSANLPVAVVEVLDPMILSSRVVDVTGAPEQTVVEIPACIAEMFDEPLVITETTRRLYVTLGQFSIVQLERDAQLIVPVLDYAIPQKECCDCDGGCAEDPCQLFSRIPFPEGQFTPTCCDSRSCNN